MQESKKKKISISQSSKKRILVFFKIGFILICWEKECAGAIFYPREAGSSSAIAASRHRRRP